MILHNHPLDTSGRKFELYTRWELRAFMARTVLGEGRTLSRTEDCFPWYDGRR